MKTAKIFRTITAPVARFHRNYLFALVLFFNNPAFLHSQSYWPCCNCQKLTVLNPNSFGTDFSVVKLCDKCKASRCERVARSQDPISNMLDLNLHTPTTDEWKKLLETNKNYLLSNLQDLRRLYCADKSVQSQIDEMINSMKSLDPNSVYSQGQVLEERKKIASIDLALTELGGKHVRNRKKITRTYPKLFVHQVARKRVKAMQLSWRNF